MANKRAGVRRKAECGFDELLEYRSLFARCDRKATDAYNAGMRLPLERHPDSPCSPATHIDVAIARPRAGSLRLSYVVTGEIGAVRLPPVMAAARSDELWRRTCFEAFVRASSGAAYYEFNFAPSTQLAAYRFSGYRSGMQMAAEAGAPAIEARASRDCYTLQASLELDRLSGLPREALWSLGLSAVIEDTRGRKSYWALAHPPGKPDFHHADGFAHDFSPAAPP